MCSANLEYQFINPTTQVALFSQCTGNCSSLLKIQWNIYEGSQDISKNLIKWSPFLSNNFTNGKNYFFGRENFLYEKQNEMKLLKEWIRVISHQSMIYFSTILKFNTGDSNRSILLFMKIVQVPWISSSISHRRTALVRSIHSMAQPRLYSQSSVPIGLMKMELKIIQFLVKSCEKKDLREYLGWTNDRCLLRASHHVLNFTFHLPRRTPPKWI